MKWVKTSFTSITMPTAFPHATDNQGLMDFILGIFSAVGKEQDIPRGGSRGCVCHSYRNQEGQMVHGAHCLLVQLRKYIFFDFNCTWQTGTNTLLLLLTILQCYLEHVWTRQFFLLNDPPSHWAKKEAVLYLCIYLSIYYLSIYYLPINQTTIYLSIIYLYFSIMYVSIFIYLYL